MIMKLFNIEINTEKSLKFFNNFVKVTFIVSAGITEFYFGQFNLIKFIICVFHLIAFIIITLILILFIKYDSIFSLIDNEFLPENTKAILMTGVILLIMAIACRIDVVIAEWNNKLSVLNYLYYLQENIKSKHGLTKRNYKKMCFFFFFFELFLIKGCIPLIVTIIYVVSFYVIIRANLMILYLLVPMIIYGIFYCAITLVVFGILSIISLYYYILLFDQINRQIQWICNKSKHRVSLANLNRLIRLIKKHNSIAYLLYLNHFITRRLILVFFITLALIQTIPLNLFLKTHNVYMKIFYLIYLFTSLSYGFTIAFILSLQISVAHKPYKLIYKILAKQGIQFKIKWKVII